MLQGQVPVPACPDARIRAQLLAGDAHGSS